MSRTNQRMEYPVLETKRTLLKVLTMEHAEEVYQHFSDEQVTEFMDIPPCKSRAEAEEIIQFHMEDTGCRWGIFLKDTDQLIGTCGFHCWVEGEQRAEIGYDLAPDHWGLGLMTEVLVSVIDFGFQRMHLRAIEATVEPENTRSIRLLEKLQFHREEVLRDHLIYFYLTADYSNGRLAIL